MSGPIPDYVLRHHARCETGEHGEVEIKTIGDAAFDPRLHCSHCARAWKRPDPRLTPKEKLGDALERAAERATWSGLPAECRFVSGERWFEVRVTDVTERMDEAKRAVFRDAIR